MKKKTGLFRNLTDTQLLLLITIVVFFGMYIGAIVFQGAGFLKPQTFFNILNANAALIITSCGMSIVMITGGIDISIGGVVALVSMSCAVYLDRMNGNVPMALLLALAIGLAFGIVQGILVAYFDIQPFIVSLAGMFFARGMTTIVNTEPFNVANEAFVALKNTRIIVPGLGTIKQKGGVCQCLCGNRCDRSSACCFAHVPAVALCKVWTQSVRRWRQQPECPDAGHQCQTDQILFPSAVQLSGRTWRLHLFYACRLRLRLPCLRYGDECDRIFDHRRYDADRRCRVILSVHCLAYFL